jgi:hypothetical protein
MVFNFGSSGNNYANTHGSDAIAPANTGISHIAQARMDNIISRANKQLINSMKVDGDPLYIWAKTQTGRPCTCCNPIGSNAGIVASLADGPSTNHAVIDPTQSELPDVNSNKFKVIKLTSQNLVNNTNDPIWESLANPTIKTNTPVVTETFDLNTPSVNLDDTQDLDLFVTHGNSQEGAEHFGDEDLDAFFAGGASGAVFGGDKTACGICFTSGWTQGYSLLNGHRFVFDASGDIPFHLNGADLDDSAHPFKFSLPTNANGYVYWMIELPVFCQRWVNVRARNNLDPAHNVLIEYAVQNLANTDPLVWNTLTLDVLNSTSNLGTRIWFIRARRQPTAFDLPEVHFTHLELVVLTMDATMSQTPQLAYNTDFQSYDAIINTQFDIAPTVVMLPRESVFSDNKYGLFWKIIDVTAGLTSKLQNFGYTVTARVVQRHEQLYNLHTLFTEVPFYLQVPGASGTTLQDYNSTVPNHYNEIVPSSDVYTELERVQGSYSVVNTNEQEGGQQVDNIQLDKTEPFIFTQVPGASGNTLQFTDMNGTVHTFDNVQDFLVFAAAVEQYVTTLDNIIETNTGTLPPPVVNLE